jgi:hypothetical protein
MFSGGLETFSVRKPVVDGVPKSLDTKTPKKRKKKP